MKLLNIFLIQVCLCYFCFCESTNLNSNEFFESIELLESYGYLKTKKNELTTISNTDNIYIEAIKKYQTYYNLNVTGILNKELLSLLKSKRCGVSDNNSNRNEKYFWNEKVITWDFIYSSDYQYKVAKEAFKIWEKYINVKFAYTPYNYNNNNAAKPNIIISMGGTKHYTYSTYENCAYNFDGPGKVLGHAALPQPYLDSVDIHMDVFENWSYKLSHNEEEENVNFLEVLVHEIGHVLGLDHVRDKNSVMYSLHRNSQFQNILDFPLHPMDIEEIQSLYGKKINNTIPLTTHLPLPLPSQPFSTEKTKTNNNNNNNKKEIPAEQEPELCNINNLTNFLIVNNNLLIFYDNWVWVKNILESGYTKPYYIQDWVQELNDSFKNLSAVYRKPNGNIVLINNNKFYDIKWPLLKISQITDGSSVSKEIKNITGAVHTSMGQTYIFFNNIHVIQLNECSNSIINRGTMHSMFPGIPPNIDGVFQYINGYMYFLKNNIIYEYSEYLRTVTKAIPFNLSFFNIDCPNESILKQLKNLLSKLIKLNFN